MSAAVSVVMGRGTSTAAVTTAEGCACLVDPEARVFPNILLFPAGCAAALAFAGAHAATHTCPSWRASGERCTSACVDCGGTGWIHPSRYDADAAFMFVELGVM